MSKRQELIDALKENIGCGIEIPLYDEEVKMCIEALEKEVSKKIYKVLPATPDESENECSECGNTLDKAMNEFNCEYCHWCGSKLDWSK